MSAALVKASLDARRAFVRAHTALTPVPFVPEIALYTATEVTPLWHATQAWLDDRGADVPFWAVPWAGGQALARFVLERPETVRGRRVLDFAAGSGLVALAALRAGAREVLAVDVDPLAEAACLENAAANHLAVAVRVADVVGTDVEADVVLAGDCWYDGPLAARVGPWLRRVATAGARVLTGDPGRNYGPIGATELWRGEVPTLVDLESVPHREARVLAIENRSNVERS